MNSDLYANTTDGGY